MRILFINLPYHGHVVPTLGLVMELIKRGNQVTYMLPFEWQEMVAGSGAEFAGYENHKKLSEQIKNAYAAAERIIKNYDFVIYEQFFFLGKHLAEKYNKPVARVFTAPATNERLMQDYIAAGGPLGIFRHKWIGKLWTKEVAKGIPMQTDCWLDEIIQNPPELNLVYTLKEYQPYGEEFSEEQYKFLGASVYERTEQKLALPKSENPVIYISLGTVVRGAAAFFRECIEAFRDEAVTVIMSVGKSFQIKKLGAIPENIHVFQSVPQLSVLKRADVFVTHGGMNSVSEALVHGVPMVVIPFMADQPTNARRVEELGLGKHLDYKTVTRAVLRDTVYAVRNDNELLVKVAMMQKRISACPGNQGGADILMDYYERVK